MVLEACMVCLDNSEWSRNGDYAPTRLEAQRQTAHMICGRKTNDNPENSVGVITMAGERVIVRVTPTSDIGKILQALYDTPTDGTADFCRGIQTAQLALKHRENKNQKQRIVVFVASPLATSEKELERLGRTLKKNNVSLDIVSLGEITENTTKLEALHKAVNNNDSSHLVECPTTSATSDLSTMVMASSIIREGATNEDVMEAAASGGGGDMIAGVDPNTDPELYYALQMSIREERERVEKLAKEEGVQSSSSQIQTQTQTPTQTQTHTAAPEDEIKPVEEKPAAVPTADQEIEEMAGGDEELKRALYLSMEEYEKYSSNPQKKEKEPSEQKKREMEPSENPSSSANTHTQPAGPYEEFLSSIPGVDMQDARIQEALKKQRTDSREPKDKTKKEENGKDGNE